MRLLLRAVFVAVWISCLAVQAQDATVPPAEMRKWMTEMDARWKAVLATEVTGPCDADVVKARQQFLAAIEAGLNKAKSAGDLAGALAWRNEKELFATAKELPPGGDPTAPEAIQQLRTAWQLELEKLGRERAARTKGVQARYVAALDQAQVVLTQHGRIDDAVLVRNERDEIAAKWLTGVPETVAAAPAGAATPAPAASTLWTSMGATQMDGKSRPLAKVEVQNAGIMRLVKDERIWSDRDVRIDEITPGLAGYKFTQFPAHGLTLKFKVMSDGIVYLGCTSRWDAAEAPDAGEGFHDRGEAAQGRMGSRGA
jgi:hypothetical protein